MRTGVVLGAVGVTALGLSAVGASMALAGGTAQDFGPTVVVSGVGGATEVGTPDPSASPTAPPSARPSAVPTPQADPSPRRTAVVHVPRAPAVPLTDDDADDGRDDGDDDGDDGDDDGDDDD